jgi:antitoxin HicB
MLSYPVTLAPDSNGTVLVGFPDIPNANSVGHDRNDALAQARDALETAIEMHIDEGRSVPMPSSSAAATAHISLSALATAKVLLWNEMHERKITKAELASRLGISSSQIEQLFALSQPTTLELIEQAAAALGRRVEVSLA